MARTTHQKARAFLQKIAERVKFQDAPTNMNMTKKWNYQQHESKNFIMEKIVGIIWSTQLLLNTTVV